RQLHEEGDALGATWPLPASRQQVVDDWMAVAKGVPGKDWTKVTLLSEGGLTPNKWIAGFTP
ncbi:MAG TPA: hypothetical protein VNH84_04410, partial [Candidatus Saccharimonadales bacterium]|nr:hypothetical protein [Candidatus Saccharimonadales bacterium]